MASANVTSQSSEAIARAIQALIEAEESGTRFVMGWAQHSNPDGNEGHGCGCGCSKK